MSKASEKSRVVFFLDQKTIFDEKHVFSLEFGLNFETKNLTMAGADRPNINPKLLKKTFLKQEELIKEHMNSIMGGIDLQDYAEIMQAKLKDLPGSNCVIADSSSQTG
jgi:hypothetical protein